MADNLRGGGPFALCSLQSAAVETRANLDPVLRANQSPILARPLTLDAAKMETNNNHEEEGLKHSIGDVEKSMEFDKGSVDDSDEEEVWESVSELASDEEYVTDDGEEEEEGGEGEFEEDEEEDDDDDDEDGEEDDDEEDDDDDEEEEVEEGNGMDDGTISSGDEGGEKCAICLCSFNNQEVGSPESCDHTFCFECIYEWSKNVTTCPVDRSVFTLILVRNTFHGEIVRQMEVKAQEAHDEDEDPTYCEVCGECDREDRLLLCDECDAGYHCECLTPPLVHIPIEEWYCPNCATPDHEDESSEEEYISNLRRPMRRVREYARAIARTQVAERVLSRVRQARELRRIDEQEQTGAASTSAPRVPKARRKTVRKRKTTKRKTTKRKTTKRKRKTTKRKTTTRKKRKSTTTTTASGTKKKRRKTRRKKRKVRRTSVGARTARPSVAKTIRRRIAGKLNLVKPKVGSMMPDIKQKGEHSLLLKRHEIGVASLSLTGSEHLFDPSGYDESHVIRGPGAQSAPTPARPSTSSASTSSGPLDLLGSIMQGQNILHMKSENITIHKDGTLSSAKKKPDEKSTAKKSPMKTAHRSSTSSTTSHKYNSEKESSKPVKDVTSQRRRSSEGHAQGHRQVQKTSETRRSGMQSLRGEASQNIHHGIKDDDLEPVQMDIDDDDDDDGDLNFMSKGKESFIGTNVGRMQQSHGTNSHSESLRTKVDCQVDELCLQNIPLQPNEGQESQDMDDSGNDESDGDVGYHGNSDNQDGDGGYEQDGGEEDQGDQEENPINNNNNNDGEDDGGDGEGGDEGEGGDGDEAEEEEEEEEAEEEEAEEEEDEEAEGEGAEAVDEEAEEAGAKDVPLTEEDQELYADLEYTDKKNDRQTEEEDHPAREEANIRNAAPDDEEASQLMGDAGNQDDGCEDDNEKGEESEEEQLAEEQEEEEGDVEEEQEVDEEEEEEEIEEGKPGAEEEQNEELKDTIDQQETEEGIAGEEEGEEAEQVEEEQKGDDDEEEEEIGDGQEESRTLTDEKSSDRTSSRPLIGELECEDISDEDNVPEDDGQQGSESDEEGMIIETSDGRVIEAKPKAQDSRKEQRTEPVESHQTPVEETESAVKHGASSAEEGEVKTDDESKKGKKARGKRKRKKRNRDKRNVVVDPRKSISLHPQLPVDRLPTRGDESSGRREGSREAFGDLRQVIQVKRDTPYTAEELRRYHECWEEYNRRRDERRVERVGTAWDQYTYDQYAYYEAWRSMGGDFATGRPWGLHVQRDRSPIYDRRKNGEPQAFDPRLETQRQSARKDNERGKEEGSRKSSEKKTKSESDKGRKDQPTKKESSRTQKDDKDKVKKEKTKSKGHIHENSARDKNGRERDGGEKDKKSRDKEKEKDRVSRNKHGHDRDKDQSKQKERERSRERDRSRKDHEHRSRERDRHRSRDRERSRDRGRERSRDKHHKRGSEREHSRSKEDHSRSRHRSRSRDRERSRKRDRSSESDRVSSKDRRRDRSRDRGRDRSREKAAHRDHDKSKDRERTREIVKKTEERKSVSSVKVPQRKERGKVTVDASGVRKILLGEKAKPKEPKKVVEKPIPVTAKVDKVKVKKVKKEKTGVEGKVEKKVKKTKIKGEKKVTKGKKKKVVSKRPLSFDVDEISAPTKKKKAPAPVEQAQKAEDIVLKPPSPLKFDDDDADDMIPVPSTTRSGSCTPDLYIDIAAPDSDLSRTVTEPSKPLPKPKSPADVAVADSSHLETDMYDPFNPTASPPSGIKSPSPIVSEASPLHDTATSSSVEVFKRAATPPPEVPPNPTSTTDVSSSDMATNPPQQGMTNEDRLMLASQASQQITKILNQLATVPVAKPRVSPESPIEQAMSSASIELGLSPEHIGGSSISVSSLGSEKSYKVDPIIPQDNIGDAQEDDIEMSAVDLYNKNSRDRYLKKLYHQERVVEEVKLAIKPHYQRKVINKEDYKEILRKSVNQVCHSKTGEINPVKIRRLIDGYVKKVQHKNKKPGDKLGKLGGGSAGKTTFKSSSKGSSKSSSKSGSKTTREPASASKLIEKGRSLGLKSK